MFKKIQKKKAAVIIAAAVLLLSISIAALAKYVQPSGEMLADLSPGEYQNLTVNCTDGYDDNGNYHIDSLSISTADKKYAIYVRVMINITWQNDNGEVYGQQPVAGKDYSLVINDVDWFCDLTDGKYYCYTDVPVGGTTEMLIGKNENQKLDQLKASPAEGYKLKAEICAQAIQAVGVTSSGLPAVEDAWSEHPRP